MMQFCKHGMPLGICTLCDKKNVQPQWQGLTDDEIVKAFNLCDWMNEPITEFAHAIEQALRIKNESR